MDKINQEYNPSLHGRGVITEITVPKGLEGIGIQEKIAEDFYGPKPGHGMMNHGHFNNFPSGFGRF